jgi:secreted PhoX family phosphatase
MASVLAATTPAKARGRRPRPFEGYGPLVPDPKGLIDLPKGFQYRVFSSEGDVMRQHGLVPSSHDGMAAFPAGLFGTWLVRNHEIQPEDVIEDGAIAVPQPRGLVYDPEAPGGTTTLLVGHNRKLLLDRVSIAGTLNNCAGGPTPWRTWLTCEEATDSLGKPHGYVFEVDPVLGGNVEPIIAMGRFDHEAVSIGRDGVAYLTEDAGEPHGCFYRFLPNRPLGGHGSLHAGGELSAMKVVGLGTTDLSIVQEPGTILDIEWVDVPNVNPSDDETSVREQVVGLGATPVPKCEGTWTGLDGSIWFVGSRGDGPSPEDPEDISAAVHAGQIWRYDPYAKTIELVVIFPGGSPYDGPDNITVGPHGYALACTDGEDDQWLVGINDDGDIFELAKNAFSDDEFAGATFSPDGSTLFVNIQGSPALTLAIWGPWRARR